MRSILIFIKNRRKDFFLFFLILTSFKVLGQKEEFKNLNTSKHKIGFDYGLGRNNGLGFTNIDIDRDYELHLFQFQYYWSFFRYKNFGAEALGQPQVNFGRIRSNQGSRNSIELGLNIGLLLRYNLWKEKMSIYGLLSSGPHFISQTPSRQANNFIFSDNFMGGINYEIKPLLFLDFRVGKRHTSNLNFQSPNGGINTFIINIGIMKLL